MPASVAYRQFDRSKHISIRAFAKKMGYDPRYFVSTLVPKLGIKLQRDSKRGYFLSKPESQALQDRMEILIGDRTRLPRGFVNIRKNRKVATRPQPANRKPNGTNPITVIANIDMILNMMKAGVPMNIEVR